MVARVFEFYLDALKRRLRITFKRRYSRLERFLSKVLRVYLLYTLHGLLSLSRSLCPPRAYTTGGPRCVIMRRK